MGKGRAESAEGGTSWSGAEADRRDPLRAESGFLDQALDGEAEGQ